MQSAKLISITLLATITTLALSALFINTTLIAQNTAFDCAELYGRDTPAFDTCIDDLLNNTAPSASTSTQEAESTTSEPVEGAPTIEEIFEQQTNQTPSNPEDNIIYTRLNEFINFLSIGVGVVITASVVVAGIQWASARGNPQKVSMAVNRLTNAGIALAMFVFMWLILNWLIPGGVFGNNTDPATNPNPGSSQVL